MILPLRGVFGFQCRNMRYAAKMVTTNAMTAGSLPTSLVWSEVSVQGNMQAS